MSRIISIVIAFLMVINVFPMAVYAESSDSVQTELYVSTQGNDENSGSESSPFLTIGRAVQEVQKHNKNMTGDIIVNIAPGRYELSDRIRLRAEDSGSNGYDVIYRGDRENMPVISGGRVVTGWQEGENGIWHAKAEHLDFARDLYINDAVGVRAQTQHKISGIRNYKDAGGAYRYVVVEKIFGYGSLAIRELKVNVPSVICGETEIEQNYLSGNAYGYRTHNGKTAAPFSYSNLGGKAITQTSYDSISLVVPLSSPSAVTHIAVESGVQGTGANQFDFRSNFKILGFEEGECVVSGGQPTFNLEDGDVLAVQDGIAGLPGQGYSGLILYHVPKQFQNKTYEYIGFYKDKKYDNGTENTADDKLQLRLNNLYIFDCKVVEQPDLLTDAASDSMVYTITNSTDHAGAYAVDNDPATYYESGSATDEKINNLVVDLGASYPIASIDYLPMNDDTAAANYSIYVSNDPQFSDKVLVHSQGATVSDRVNASNYVVFDETPYRYVLVEKMAGTGKLGVAEINVNVPSEYYADAAGVSRANFEIKNRGVKVWRSKTSSLSNAQVGQLNGENTLQTYEHYWNGLTADSTEALYMYYDLGASGAKVDTIAYADCASGADASNFERRKNFKVILSNNADLSNGVTVYVQDGIAGGNDTLANSGLVLYHVPEEYKNTNYRYVGIYKDTAAYINAQWRLKLGYGIMDIYTVK